MLSYIFTLISALSFTEAVLKKPPENITVCREAPKCGCLVHLSSSSPVPVYLPYTVQFSLNFAEVLTEMWCCFLNC